MLTAIGPAATGEATRAARARTSGVTAHGHILARTGRTGGRDGPGGPRRVLRPADSCKREWNGHPIRGNSGFTLPSSSSAITRRSSALQPALAGVGVLHLLPRRRRS